MRIYGTDISQRRKSKQSISIKACIRVCIACSTVEITRKCRDIHDYVYMRHCKTPRSTALVSSGALEWVKPYSRANLVDSIKVQRVLHFTCEFSTRECDVGLNLYRR